MSKPSAAQGSLASAGGTDPADAMTIDHGTAAAEDWAAALAVWVNLPYNNTLGVERDVAARWWSKAARLGDGDGQAMLGAAHHLGAGAERNPVTALAWLIRARTLRSKFADRFYDGVRNSCTPEQRREAERRACLPIEAEEASL